LERARALSKDDWPQRAPRSDGPPPPRSWGDKDPIAAKRLAAAREIVSGICEEMSLAPEIVLSPDLLRRLCWQPPSPIDAPTVGGYLQSQGARPWQIELLLPGLIPALRG